MILVCQEISAFPQVSTTTRSGVSRNHNGVILSLLSGHIRTNNSGVVRGHIGTKQDKWLSELWGYVVECPSEDKAVDSGVIRTGQTRSNGVISHARFV